jgi:hypothetical protein
MHLAPILLQDPILVITTLGVTKAKSYVIPKMTYKTSLKQVNMLYVDNANVTHQNPNTTTYTWENPWNVHIASYNTILSGTQ